MAWMKIKSLDSDVEITVPIFEFNAGYFANISGHTIKTSTSHGYNTVSFLYNQSPFLTEVQASGLFDDWITDAADPNSMLQINMSYAEDAQSGYMEPDALFLPVQIGVQPDDFDTYRWLYYTRDLYNNAGETWAFYRYAVGAWDALTQYYTLDTNPRKRGYCRYIADTGCAFSVTRGFAAADTYSTRGTSDFIMRNGSGQYEYAQHCGYYDEHDDLLNCDISGVSEIGFFEQSWGSGGKITEPSNVQIFFVHAEYNGDDYYGLAKIATIDGADRPYPALVLITLIDKSFWGTSVTDIAPPSPGSWGDDSTTGGGDGTFDAPSDNRGTADGSDIDSIFAAQSRVAHADDIINNGGFNVYQLQPQVIGDIVGVLYGSSYFSRFANYMYNPLSAILAYHLLPSVFVKQRKSGGVDVTRDLTAGGFNVSSELPTPQQFPILESLVHANIGSCDIAKYFGAYPDFAPYTTATLHLPYIGDIQIDINTVARGKLAVDYVCDVISGNCAAWIYVKDMDGSSTYLYSGTGNCAYSVPLYAQSSNGSAVGKIVGGAAGLIAGGMSGNITAIAGGGLSLASGLIGLGERQTHSIGSMSGNVSLLIDTVCFLHVQRPHWCNPADYPALQGIPLSVSGSIADLGVSGKVSVSAIELTGSSATEPEIAEIERLLRSGVFIVPPT